MKRIISSTLMLVTILFASLFVNCNLTYAKSNSDSKEVVVYLVRHGETTANVMHRAQGWSDYTLTQNGIDGAKYLGRGLKGTTFKAAYSGDLTRQEKTAQGVLNNSGNKKINLQIDNNLRECNYGSYEGRPDAAQNIPEIAKYYGFKDSKEFLKKTGKNAINKMQDGYYELDKQNKLNTELPAKYRAEASKTVEKRMSQSLTRIVKKQQKSGGGNVLVVSSGMSISLFISTLNSKQYTGSPMKNDAVTKVVYKDGKFKVSGSVGSLKYFNNGKKELAK
ncbi:histidine phosphatase family protein [Bombilactobacillus bombi]|uniref:histidine phosphatase family protein n=1 Tax=Bombilactobacillus bombi TaxID=1303590 RepID=UPI0013C3706A|nr:histidine phosphatase family protein [Bombilactobacillus bombi]